MHSLFLQTLLVGWGSVLCIGVIKNLFDICVRNLVTRLPGAWQNRGFANLLKSLHCIVNELSRVLVHLLNLLISDLEMTNLVCILFLAAHLESLVLTCTVHNMISLLL